MFLVEVASSHAMRRTPATYEMNMAGMIEAAAGTAAAAAAAVWSSSLHHSTAEIKQQLSAGAIRQCCRTTA
jgi:hypothetical protein